MESNNEINNERKKYRHEDVRELRTTYIKKEIQKERPTEITTSRTNERNT